MDQATLRELQAIPLFSTLSADRMGCLGPGEIIQFEAGKIIANEGDPLDSFYVVLEGEMRISRNYGNQAILMGVAKPGSFIGEVPLLLDSPIVAPVRT